MRDQLISGRFLHFQQFVFLGKISFIDSKAEFNFSQGSYLFDGDNRLYAYIVD